MFIQNKITKLLTLSASLFVASLGHAHTNYSARYVMPDELQDWVIYSEDVHGDKEQQKVKEQLAFSSGYYFGFGLGSTHVSPEGSSNGFATDDDSSSGYKLYFGQQFKPNWAWEVSYADLGEAGLGNNINTTLDNLVPNAEIDYKVPAAWIKYLPLDPNENISVDLKAGLSFLSNSANDSRIGYTAQTSTQLALGFGAQLRFAERFYVRFDYDSYDTDATYTGISLGMYTGGHDDHKQAPAAPVILDSDKDGVIDANDRCPTTPLGRAVDSLGCAIPVDADKDGVLDNVDQCLGTPEHRKVNAKGCVMAKAIPKPVVNCEAFPEVVEGLTFYTNSAKLSAASKSTLSGIANIFKANPKAVIEIQAHTDSKGSGAYNLKLSDLRAASVKSYLVSLGVDPSQLQSQGYGESNPIADNATVEGRAQNRRVELHALGKACQ